jgi:CRISPR-associated protein Csb3
MSEITLASCAPDVLLSHLALYGLAAILEAGGLTAVRAAWSRDGDPRPVVSAPGLTGEQAAAVIAAHARRAADPASWLHRSITVNGSPRALMSPRLSALGDEATWRHAQQQRHQVLDELTASGNWLDLRFLAALGEPCYWVRDRQDRIQQDNATSRLEMQPRNRGSEFVGNRLRKVAAAVAARTASQILSGVLGQTVRDEADGDAADSRTATGLAAPGPADNALAWCALWGISQLPLAMRVQTDPRIPVTAVTTGHLGRGRSEWFYAPVWAYPWRPARIRTILAAAQTRTVASEGMDRNARPLPAEGTGRTQPMATGSDLTAARRWLADRQVTGIMRFPVERFGSDNAPERRAMRGQPIPVRERI